MVRKSYGRDEEKNGLNDYIRRKIRSMKGSFEVIQVNYWKQ